MARWGKAYILYTRRDSTTSVSGIYIRGCFYPLVYPVKVQRCWESQYIQVYHPPVWYLVILFDSKGKISWIQRCFGCYTCVTGHPSNQYEIRDCYIEQNKEAIN